jgi:hypothetical protein
MSELDRGLEPKPERQHVRSYPPLDDRTDELDVRDDNALAADPWEQIQQYATTDDEAESRIPVGALVVIGLFVAFIVFDLLLVFWKSQ